MLLLPILIIRLDTLLQMYLGRLKLKKVKLKTESRYHLDISTFDRIEGGAETSWPPLGCS